MATVALVFALIEAAYASVLFRFVTETAHKGISEFAFSIAIRVVVRYHPTGKRSARDLGPVQISGWQDR